jgi:moderate conductance mechanosensitive channel
VSQFLTTSFWQKTSQNALSAAIEIAVLLLVYWILRPILFRVIDASLDRLMARHAARAGSEERASRLRTIQALAKSVAGYLLLFILVVMILTALTLDVTGIITTAGIGGLAIGFGAQKLIKDVISGFFIILEDQFAVDDYVTIGAASGTVEEIGMRVTRLRDDTRRVWIISNGDITIVTNHSRAPVESYIEIGVATTADVKMAEAAINSAGEEMKRDPENRLVRAPRALGVASWDAARTVLRVEVVAEPRSLAAVQLRARESIRDNLLAAGIPLA